MISEGLTFYGPFILDIFDNKTSQTPTEGRMLYERSTTAPYYGDGSNWIALSG